MKTTIINTVLSKADREAVLNYDNEKEKWTLETTIQSYFNRAVKKGWTVVEEYRYKNGSLVGGVLEAPKNAITLRSVNQDSPKY